MLDQTTIYIVTALVSLVVGVTLLAAWATSRFGLWAVCWGVANLAFGVGGMQRAFIGLVPQHLLSSGCNVLELGGYLLTVQGMRLLAGRRPHWPWLLAILVPLAIPLCVFYLPGQYSARVAYNDVIIAVCDLWVAVAAVGLGRRERLHTAWIVAGLFGVTVPLFLFRGYLALRSALGTEMLQGNGMSLWLAALLAAIRSLRGAIPVLMIAERSHQQLATLAHRDALTGALNRAGLAHVRGALTGHAALAMMDLDHFKSLNDRYGHAQGDAALRLLADAVRGGTDERDVFVRLGGDEFVLLLPGRSAGEAEQVAHRIRAGFAAAMGSLPIVAPVPTISVGISEGELAGDGLRGLMAEADAALYAAKQAGRDRVSVARPAEPGSGT